MTPKELYLFPDRMKCLREGAKLTQSDVAKALNLTRSSVNSWEMGGSTPSAKYVVELAKLFGVSTDYLLGMEENASISVEGLTPRQISSLLGLIVCFKSPDDTQSDDAY